MILKLNSVTTSIGSFSFKVKNVVNPSSTKASAPFTNIYVTDSNGYNIMQLIPTFIPTVKTTLSANILAYSLYQDSLAMGASVTYRISFIPTN